MASRVCWSCGTFTHMTVVVGSGQVIPTGRGYQGVAMSRKQAVFTCDQCHRMSIGEANDSGSTYGRDVEPYLEGDRVRDWFPVAPMSREFPDVPEHIADAAAEATLCLSIGAYRAVGSLTRAVVEATAKDKGITTGNLWVKIDAMYDAHLIREHVKEAAHEVRHFGNDMAHGDFVDPVTVDEATEAVELMAEVLNEVFQSPARVARVKAAREKKKAAE